MIRLILPFPPSINRLWRASKGGRVYRSGEYAGWRSVSLWRLREQMRMSYPGQSVEGAYRLTVRAVKPDRRRRDLGNLEKAISDIIVAAGIVEDDHLCQQIVLAWVEDGPECEILIEPHRAEIAA